MNTFNWIAAIVLIMNAIGNLSMILLYKRFKNTDCNLEKAHKDYQKHLILTIESLERKIHQLTKPQ